MLKIENVGYWYEKKEPLYKNVNLEFETGKLYGILGASGSGKTTFLALISGLDIPKEGEVLYEGESLKKIGLTNYRNKYMSIVFQSYNLLPYMTALQNILTVMEITKSKRKNRKEFAIKMLEKVGIDEKMAKKNVMKLSGGQQQRVAIVRAMCCETNVVVADEPTGNLDEDTSKDIIELFKEMAHSQNKCVIVVTHEKEVAKECDSCLLLKKRKFSLI